MSDFANMSGAQEAPDVEQYLKSPPAIEQIEARLLENYDLRYESSRVTYNFPPHLLSRNKSIDLSTLVEELQAKYHLEFKMPEYLQADGLRAGQILSTLLDREGLSFNDGLLSYRDNGFPVVRVIPTVNFHHQNFHVVVVGKTGEAEFVAGSLINHFLRLPLDDDVVWDLFSATVDSKAFRTVTRLRLPFPLESLLSTEFLEFIHSTTRSDIGPKFGYIPLVAKDVTPTYAIVPVLHDLRFAVNVFDPVSGDDDDGELWFQVVNRTHRGKGVVTVSSTLSSDNHLRVLDQLLHVPKQE